MTLQKDGKSCGRVNDVYKCVWSAVCLKFRAAGWCVRKIQVPSQRWRWGYHTLLTVSPTHRTLQLPFSCVRVGRYSELCDISNTTAADTWLVQARRGQRARTTNSGDEHEEDAEHNKPSDEWLLRHVRFFCCVRCKEREDVSA